MNERFLREALRADCREAEKGDARASLARLRPDVFRAAARLQKRREARRQNLLFLGGATIFLLLAACGYRAWTEGGLTSGDILLGAGALMGAILALSPLMAYCIEREREHEKS